MALFFGSRRLVKILSNYNIVKFIPAKTFFSKFITIPIQFTIDSALMIGDAAIISAIPTIASSLIPSVSGDGEIMILSGLLGSIILFQYLCPIAFVLLITKYIKQYRDDAFYTIQI